MRSLKRSGRHQAIALAVGLGSAASYWLSCRLACIGLHLLEQRAPCGVLLVALVENAIEIVVGQRKGWHPVEGVLVRLICRRQDDFRFRPASAQAVIFGY